MAPGSARYKSPGSTVRELRDTPVTDVAAESGGSAIPRDEATASRGTGATTAGRKPGLSVAGGFPVGIDTASFCSDKVVSVGTRKTGRTGTLWAPANGMVGSKCGRTDAQQAYLAKLNYLPCWPYLAYWGNRAGVPVDGGTL
ncbi:hypothetical protein AHiyo1_33570 [Arthrobacter sp. Hiyo1]|nr:hypothetical protein AHiyo1_33570 [Arthrobacter sp. Hiyo1]